MSRSTSRWFPGLIHRYSVGVPGLVLLALLFPVGAVSADTLIGSKADFKAQYGSRSLTELLLSGNRDRYSALELSRRYSDAANNSSQSASASLRYYALAATQPILPGESNSQTVDKLLVPVVRASRLATNTSATTPLAVIELDTHSGPPPLQVNLSAAGSSGETLVHYAWSLGDGRVTSGSSASILYEEAGEYSVALVVLDTAGRSARATAQIVVTASAPPPSVPVLLSPLVDEIHAAGSPIVLSWTRAADVDSYEVELNDISASITQSSDVQTADTLCDAVTCSFTFSSGSVNAGMLSWQVKAFNEGGESDWATRLLELVNKPLQPVNVLPANDDEVVYLSDATFVWEALDDAAKYEFHVFDKSTGELTFIPDIEPSAHCEEGLGGIVGVACSVTMAINLPVSPYHAWRVRAWNTAGWGPYSRTVFGVIDPENLIDDPPEAAISVNAFTGAVPFPVVLDASLSTDDGQIVEYRWTVGSAEDVFGADLISLEQTLTEVGSVPVTLTVTDDAGMSHSASIELNATTNMVPIASFEIFGFDGRAVGIAPLSVQFDPEASSDDDMLTSYLWDFGDGSDTVVSSSPLVQSHQFQSAGVFTVSLQVEDSVGQVNSFSRTVKVLGLGAEPAAGEIDAARLLTQATFGPTSQDIALVKALGIENWVDIQQSLLEPPHLDYVSIYSNGSNRAPRHEIWWKRVVEGSDQLRERVAFGLSQIFVVSDVGYTLGNGQYGNTNYYDILRTHAFGNYRDLLEAVTLSPIMGTYLSMLQNARGEEAGGTRADENFAREVLQLFSIGLTELNLDGSSTGVPSFTLSDVENFARVFTGWNYKDAGQWNRSFFDNPDRINSMEPFEDYHDSGSKVLLGGAISPEGLSAREDLEFALDNIFNHPNVGPFIGRQLIMRLVTSNPSPAYISRIATVFNNNGEGVRGDLGAVIKAILLDTEARQITGPAYGKLREPVLRLSHLWRAFNVTPGNHGGVRGDYNTYSPPLYVLETLTGQAVLKSPSVFNFFKPEYSPKELKQENLVAPEFEIMTAGNEIGTTNRIGLQIQRHYLGTPHASDLNPSYLDLSAELLLASDAALLVDHLDLLLTNGAMSIELKQVLIQHIESLPDTEQGLSTRVRDAITLIMASPDYLVQM